MPQHIEDMFEDKARGGDGLFAIAYALLQVANEQKRIGSELSHLGLGHVASDMGATGFLGARIEDGLQSIAAAIENLSPD